MMVSLYITEWTIVTVELSWIEKCTSTIFFELFLLGTPDLNGVPLFSAREAAASSTQEETVCYCFFEQRQSSQLEHRIRISPNWGGDPCRGDRNLEYFFADKAKIAKFPPSGRTQFDSVMT
jgi:hypothetical protein